MLYKKFIKRAIDVIVSFIGIIILIPVWLIISLALYVDDPGPVLFKQQRVGKGKKLFKIWKFRSMKMSTPHDVPTHMLKNPEQYITKVGRFLRRTSLA
ncbi:MAG: sugar transferase [Oscillospiraceae bacterium]|nr:sugar transferase [Oscillospiraceae bacterium]